MGFLEYIKNRSISEYYSRYESPGIRLRPIAKKILDILDRGNETLQSLANAIDGTTKEDIDEVLTFLITRDKIKYNPKRGEYSLNKI